MPNKKNILRVSKIIKNFQDGDKIKAYNELKKIFNKNKSDLNVLYNLSYMSEILNYKDEAIKGYTFILKKKPGDWNASLNLYLIYIKNNKLDDALVLVRSLLNIKPNFYQGLRDLAFILLEKNKFNEAYKNINLAINIKSDDYFAFNIRGLIEMKLNKINNSIISFNNSIKINPKDPSCYNNLGKSYQELGDIIIAFKNYKKSYKLDKNYAPALINIANIMQLRGRHKSAIKFYKKTINNYDNSEIYSNIAKAYSEINDTENANKYFKEAYKLNPKNIYLIHNYSFFLLYNQDYINGWKFYDSRLEMPKSLKANQNYHIIKKYLLPINGKNLNKTLIIREQGVGDEILFSSIYEDLIENSPNCKIECDSRLLNIFNRSFKNNLNFVNFSSISADEKKVKSFDNVIYAGSLGSIFRKDITDFPRKKFLVADSKNKEDFKIKLDKIDSKPKIGISWKSILNIHGTIKSLKLSQLLPLFKNSEQSYINLQYGETKSEINDFEKKNNIKISTIENLDLFNDLDSLASLLSNLDLFITVSNSTAHLAGALGIKTLLISPQNNILYHYWNQPNNITPWYENINIIKFNKNINNTIKEVQIFIEKNLK